MVSNKSKLLIKGIGFCRSVQFPTLSMAPVGQSPTIPGKEVIVNYGDHPLRLFLDMGVGIGGDKWPAADMFCSMITLPRWKDFFGHIFQEKRVLELGSGNGVAGILIDKAFSPKEVCVTDLESHVPHIRHNIQLNDCSEIVSGLSYDWLASVEYLDSALQAPFDVILALECVYREDLYLPLIETIKAQSHKGTVCFLGSTRQFTKPSFFRLLAEHGLAYKKLPHEMLPESMADQSIGMFVIHLV